jgi:DNA polymerase elongation subunit (family B)
MLSTLYIFTGHQFLVQEDGVMSSEKLSKLEEMIVKGECNPNNISPCVKEITSIINENIDPESLVVELESKEKKYDKLQLANKVLMNALYGYFGTSSSRFYRKDIAEGITSVGQEESLRVQGLLEREGYEILYGDSVIGSSKIIIGMGDEQEKTWIETTIEKFFNFHSNLSYKDKRTKRVISFKKFPSFQFFTPSIDLKTGKLKISRIKRIIRHRPYKSVFKLKTVAKDVVITKDHSCIVKRNGKLIIVKPEEIIAGKDKVVLVEFNTLSRRKFRIEISPVIDISLVDEKYGKYVYDLDVEGTSTFFANGILVHNTDSMFILVKGMPEEIKNDVDKAKEWIKKNFVPRINELSQKELETMAKEIGVKNPILGETYHFTFKQEVIARSGIFLPSVKDGKDEAKKRYDLYVVDEEGVPKDKFVHAGTPLKQSKLPDVVKQKFKDFLTLLLKEMITDPEQLLKPARELREEILNACRNWDIEKIGSNFQFSKPFEEYKTGKAPEFAIQWNEICEKLGLPPYQVGGKYKFIEVKPRKELNWDNLSKYNLSPEQKEIIKHLFEFSKKRVITSLALVLEDDEFYLDILKSMFEIDENRAITKYVENIFKPYFKVLGIPIEKIAFDFGDVDDLL